MGRQRFEVIPEQIVSVAAFTFLLGLPDQPFVFRKCPFECIYGWLPFQKRLQVGGIVQLWLCLVLGYFFGQKHLNALAINPTQLPPLVGSGEMGGESLVVLKGGIAVAAIRHTRG